MPFCPFVLQLQQIRFKNGSNGIFAIINWHLSIFNFISKLFRTYNKSTEILRVLIELDVFFFYSLDSFEMRFHESFFYGN